MNELNQYFSENLSMFLMGFRDDVVKGIEEYLENNASIMNKEQMN